MKTSRHTQTDAAGAGSESTPALAACSTNRRRSLVLLRIVVPLSIFLVVFAQFSFAASSFKVLHAFGAGTDGGRIQSSVTLDKKGNVYGTTSKGGAGGYGTVFKLKKMPDGSWAERILQNFSFGDPNGQEPFAGVTFDDAGNLYGTTVAGGANRAGTVFKMTPGPNGWVFEVIYDFCSQPDCSDGGNPWARVVFDKAGNLYGTAFNVFALTPGPDGWTETVLYNFCAQPDCYDGRVPYEGVILDAKGNLYGVTQLGGDQNSGVVYKLKHLPDGTWHYRVLHRFHGPPDDGEVPGPGMLLARDISGNLYGTTTQGGPYTCDTTTCGLIFKLSRQPDGHWKESILHQFKLGKGGYWPSGGVVIDSAGNLYGTTGAGGDSGCDCGAAYKLAANPDGTWTYTVLHRFRGTDGLFPDANLVMDDKGNLYGTTLFGGPYGGGVVFKLTP